MIDYLKKIVFLTSLLLSLMTFADSDGRRDALVIIDMQAPFITRGGNDQLPENVQKVKAIIKMQRETIKAAKAAEIPIIFAEYESFGKTNAELKEEAKDYKETKYFIKDSDGMFEESNSNKKELIDYLQSKNIGNLIILGANGGACVRSTIVGALEENYSVTAFLNGIADFNYKDFIYPYKKYKLKPNCRDCKFRETDDLNVIIKEMESMSTEMLYYY